MHTSIKGFLCKKKKKPNVYLAVGEWVLNCTGGCKSLNFEYAKIGKYNSEQRLKTLLKKFSSWLAPTSYYKHKLGSFSLDI